MNIRAPIIFDHTVFVSRAGAAVRVVHTGLYSRYAFVVLNNVVNAHDCTESIRLRAKIEYNGEVVIEVAIDKFIDNDNAILRMIAYRVFTYARWQVSESQWNAKTESVEISFPAFTLSVRDMHFIFDFLMGTPAEQLEKIYAQDLRECWIGHPLDPVSAELVQALNEQAESLKEENEKETKQLTDKFHELLRRVDEDFTKAINELRKAHQKKIDEIEAEWDEEDKAMCKRLNAKRAALTKEYTRILQTTDDQHEALNFTMLTQ